MGEGRKTVSDILSPPPRQSDGWVIVIDIDIMDANSRGEFAGLEVSDPYGVWLGDRKRVGVPQADDTGVALREPTGVDTLLGVPGGVMRGRDMTDSDLQVPMVAGRRSLRKVANA